MNTVKLQKARIKVQSKSEFVTNDKSISYKLASEKVLNWTSKGAYLNFKEPSLQRLKSLFTKPKEHVLTFEYVKIIYNHHLTR